MFLCYFFFFQAEDGIRDIGVTGVQTCALPILLIVGQTVALLQKLGAQQYIGTVMVTVIVRELGPLLTALIVLARAGTSNEIGRASCRERVEISVVGV